jgi:hypothetical protein
MRQQLAIAKAKRADPKAAIAIVLAGFVLAAGVDKGISDAGRPALKKRAQRS